MKNVQSRMQLGGLRDGHVREFAHALMLAAIFGIAVSAVVWPVDVTAQGEATPTVPPGGMLHTPTDLTLYVGETATLDDGALQVTLLQVSEDSRCPKDVVCVWTGRATVVLLVVVDGADGVDATATLYPGQRHQRSADRDALVDRYSLALTDMQPYPERPHSAPARVVATIRAESVTGSPAATTAP